MISSGCRCRTAPRPSRRGQPPAEVAGTPGQSDGPPAGAGPRLRGSATLRGSAIRFGAHDAAWEPGQGSGGDREDAVRPGREEERGRRPAAGRAGRIRRAPDGASDCGQRRKGPAGRGRSKSFLSVWLAFLGWRHGRESNPRTRICSPLHHHSATAPSLGHFGASIGSAAAWGAHIMPSGRPVKRLVARIVTPPASPWCVVVFMPLCRYIRD